MSNIDDTAAARYDAERDRTDFSPAQPDDATRIDDDARSESGRDDPAPDVKHDHAQRMKH
jgi:hypothetical protein